MAQKHETRFLTREDILALPEAPEGERSCDIPLTPKELEWIDRFLRVRSILHDAVADLIPGYDRRAPDAKQRWWRRALEVLKATGLSVEQFNQLSPADEIRVVRCAVEMKKEQRAAAAIPSHPIPAEAPKIQTGWLKAWQARERALVNVRAERPTEDDLYSWLRDHDHDDYDLPSADSWKRYVRAYQKAMNGRANAPRGGRTGRSIVRMADT